MPKNRKKFSSGTVDPAEVGQFDLLGNSWWDENGPMKPLHRLNPVRLGYIRDAACAHFERDAGRMRPLSGLAAADIGCGGGLVAEPLRRMGAQVSGIDAGANNIKAARAHARRQGLDIDYRATTVEAMAQAGERFDIVTALEVVEHVADPALFLSSCCAIVKDGGILILSTLNRTAKSFALGIVAAEYVLRWLPAGTHDWRKFMKPSEMAAGVTAGGLDVTDVTGLVYSPLARAFSLSREDLAVNYLMTAVRPA